MLPHIQAERMTAFVPPSPLQILLNLAGRPRMELERVDRPSRRGQQRTLTVTLRSLHNEQRRNMVAISTGCSGPSRCISRSTGKAP
jgi:hypothetical protein